jgi:SAM-dependent methyltransferase
MNQGPVDKAAERGVPSLVWRAGQDRRLAMITAAAGERLYGRTLVDGSGLGMYLARLSEVSAPKRVTPGQTTPDKATPDKATPDKAPGPLAGPLAGPTTGPSAGQVVGLEIEFSRCQAARQRADRVINGAGEYLPFPMDSFDLVISHEVLEHVSDDRLVLAEIVRTLRTGGRLVLLCPNRGYPFETHGIYWRGRYHFGNIPLVNYLPRRWRDRLAPHVAVYTRRDLEHCFADLPVRYIKRTVIFGAYDNIIARFGAAGRMLRFFLQTLERTPLRALGLSHFWVVEKTA